LHHENGITCDLTELITAGAKLTVLNSHLHRVWGIPHARGRKEDYVYFRLRNACKRWEKQGMLEYRSKAIDPHSLELTQKSGVYVRAAVPAGQEPPYLINHLQNSNCFAAPRKRLRFPEYELMCELIRCDISPQQAAEYADILNSHQPLTTPVQQLAYIPGRCGFWRSQAIRVARGIDTYEWFIRDKNKNLNPELQKRLNQIQLMFEAWKEETLQKSIVLKKLGGSGEYITKPYATRFTDDGRKSQLIFTYNEGIRNSLKKFSSGVFLTLTTDPLIWMTEEGREFTRRIPDPHISNKVHSFTATGKGGNLQAADRHESTAFRKWYEAECRRRGHRIPYMRCIEFQENGLIHDHILLFDIAWDKNFKKMAELWGSKYAQGYMHDVYEVRNDGEKWVWKTAKPTDTQGRDPADYLKKYLIKALYDESGHSMYWVTNKRFFTMSESIRYLSTDEKIRQEEFLKEHAATDSYAFVGAVSHEHVDHLIKSDIRRSEGLKPPVIPTVVTSEVRTKSGQLRKILIPYQFSYEEERQGCEFIPEPPPPPPATSPEQAAYEEWLRADDLMRRHEQLLMEKRRAARAKIQNS
jgi:hypothetical protein